MIPHTLPNKIYKDHMNKLHGGSQIGREDPNYGGDEGSPRSTRARAGSPGGGDETDGENDDKKKSRQSRGDGDEKEKIEPLRSNDGRMTTWEFGNIG